MALRTSVHPGVEAIFANASVRCELVNQGALPLPWPKQPFHAPDDRFYLIEGGRGWIALDTARFRLRPGAAFLIPAGTVQQGETRPGHPFALTWIHFTGVTHETLHLLRLVPMPLALRGATAKRLADLAGTMREEWKGEAPGRELALKSTLLRMLLVAYRAPKEDHAAPDERLPDDAVPERTGGEASAAVSRVVDTIGRRFDEPLALPDLAEAAGMPPGRLNRIFKRLTGMPPVRFLQEQRLRRARELLVAGNDPVHAVAEAVGFEDPYYFSRVFRKRTGVSPTAFREAARRESAGQVPRRSG